MPDNAAEIMTRPVVTVLPQTSLAQIAEVLSTKRISAVPVCDRDGRLAGIVSEEDVLRPHSESIQNRRDRWLTLLAEGETLGPEFLDYIRTDARSAAEVMASQVQTADEAASLPELAEIMIRHRVKRIPIVREGRVVGIVSRSDLVRAMAGIQRPQAPATSIAAEETAPVETATNPSMGTPANARDIMTEPAATLREDAGLADAIRIMVGKRISGIPVVDYAGRLVGIFTEGDLLRRAEVGTADRHSSALRRWFRGPGLSAEEYVRANSRRVSDLMTRDPVSISPGMPLDDVVALMERKRIKRVPVVVDEQVVGVISRADFMRAIGKVLGTTTEAGDGDGATLTRLEAELERQPWYAERNVQLSVEQGVVRLEGFVSDPRVRAALRVLAQNVSGNPQVDDKIEVVDPTTGMVVAA